MKLLGLVVVLLTGCATNDGPASDPHEVLTDCPSWTSPAGPPKSCESACEPRAAETPEVTCRHPRNATANPYGDHAVSLTCDTTFLHGDTRGCCGSGPDITGKNFYVLFYEC